MPTISSAIIPAPKSWDEFEDITKSALEATWKSTLSRHGRQGQRQDGVDIFGDNAKGEFVGVQCKNTIGGVSESVVDSEVSLAESFRPVVNTLFIATTAPRDVHIQKYVRNISADRHQKSLFKVELLFWEDIAQFLSEDEAKFFKHYPQFSPNSSSTADSTLFSEFLQLLPSAKGVIAFLDQNNMAGFSFRSENFEPLREFCSSWDNAEHEFHNVELESLRKSLLSHMNEYWSLLATETWPVNSNPNFSTVPPEWEYEQPERFNKVVSKFHELAKSIVEIHQELIRTGKKHLAV